MIQELTNCGPSRTYPVYYLEDAMSNLGDCFDYAVNDYGAEGSEVAELFCLSGVAREFERGNAWVVSGKSGWFGASGKSSVSKQTASRAS